MRRNLLGIVIGVLCFCSGQIFYSQFAYGWGTVKASIDVLRGKYQILAYCGSDERQSEYNEVLNKYNIQVVVVGGCDSSGALIDEIRGYNSVSVDAIYKKYGRIPLSANRK